MWTATESGRLPDRTKVQLNVSAQATTMRLWPKMDPRLPPRRLLRRRPLEQTFNDFIYTCICGHIYTTSDSITSTIDTPGSRTASAQRSMCASSFGEEPFSSRTSNWDLNSMERSEIVLPLSIPIELMVKEFFLLNPVTTIFSLRRAREGLRVRSCLNSRSCSVSVVPGFLCLFLRDSLATGTLRLLPQPMVQYPGCTCTTPTCLSALQPPGFGALWTKLRVATADVKLVPAIRRQASSSASSARAPTKTDSGEGLGKDTRPPRHSARLHPQLEAGARAD